jgi:hypothetical protein
MKHKVFVASILVMFLLPAFALAAEIDKFVAAKAAPTTTDEVVVPLVVTNSNQLWTGADARKPPDVSR